MSLRILFTALFIFIVVILISQDKYSWEKEKEANGIIAYVKKNPDTKVRSVKVETITAARLSEVVSILKDVKNHHKWVFANSEARILDSIDTYNWVYYSKSDLQWPIYDRDLITYVKLSQDSIDYTVTLRSDGAPEYMDEKEGCIRIKHVESIWKLIPQENGNINITFKLTLDVGGAIPIWFINLAVTRGPIQTMAGLLKMIDTGEYSDCRLDYIKEL